jgi:hypothetical protein
MPVPALFRDREPAYTAAQKGVVVLRCEDGGAHVQGG